MAGMYRRVFATLLLSVGCAGAAPTTNPSFDMTTKRAVETLRQLEAQPKALRRPLVILGGFADLGFGPRMYARQVDRVVDGCIIRIAFATCVNFEQCRLQLIRELDRQLPESQNDGPVEIDVIGQSMGGLIALYSALDDPTLGGRVRIHRVFTLSAPLSGARLAMLTPFNVFGFQADMRPGSTLYQKLAKAPFDFPIYSYTLLNDTTVGEAFSALPGRSVWWLDSPRFQRAHVAVFSDPRILLDIALRLRDEPPVALDPPAPLPVTVPTTLPARR
jgi:pimeloyl-ACP methyl ester carboxylesterase